jgi:predicted RNase H-like HicB family nuclease
VPANKRLERTAEKRDRSEAGRQLDWHIAASLSENVASMKYKVVLKKSKEGYSVSCPGLPGCWSQGKTQAEALENIQDAIREYLQAAIKISKGSKVREVEVAV